MDTTDKGWEKGLEGKVTERRWEEAFIVDSVLGVLAFNPRNELVERVLFPPDPKRIAKALMRLERGEVTPEVREVLRRLSRRGFRVFTFENRALARALQGEAQMGVRFKERTPAGDLLRNRLVEMAVDMGMVEEERDLWALIHEVALRMARGKVTQEFEEVQHMILQAVGILEELDKVINVLSMKAREWYGIHFPELGRLIGDHETYMRLVAELGDRANFTARNLEGIGLPAPLSREVAAGAARSLGAPLRSGDLEMIRGVCREILSLYDLRRRVSDYLASLTQEVAPNTVEVAGPLLTAKLIAKAGGLTKLAMMSSSKIQVLGAEKAMFRAIRTGSRPPKHGLIFQHPLIHSAPRRQRGKIARVLAGKLAMAARADAFSGRFIGDKLRGDLEERVQEIGISKSK